MPYEKCPICDRKLRVVAVDWSEDNTGDVIAHTEEIARRPSRRTVCSCGLFGFWVRDNFGSHTKVGYSTFGVLRQNPITKTEETRKAIEETIKEWNRLWNDPEFKGWYNMYWKWELDKKGRIQIEGELLENNQTRLWYPPKVNTMTEFDMGVFTDWLEEKDPVGFKYTIAVCRTIQALRLQSQVMEEKRQEIEEQIKDLGGKE